MLRVAFDLGGMPLVTFREQTGGITPKRHRGGEEQRFAGNEFLGLLHVGNDLFDRLPRAGRESRQREGRAHQLQKMAAIESLQPFRGAFRKLAMQKLRELPGARHFIETAPKRRPVR